MELSRDLLKQFANIANGNSNKKPTATYMNATAVVSDGVKYVQIDGSDQLTPIAETMGIQNGDRVMVTIENHQATVIGNYTYPADARTANTALQTAQNTVMEFEGIRANMITTETLSANLAEIGYLTAEEAVIAYAKITELEATAITTKNFEAEAAKIKLLTVDQANANYLNVVEADIKYANIQLSNVEVESVGTLFAKVGILNDVTIADGYVTGVLNGVRINADVITAGTLSVDRLMITGENSIVYQINVASSGLSLSELADEKYQKYLNGTDIVARSITADRIAAGTITANEINVSNLFAQDITATGTIRGVKLEGATGEFTGSVTTANIDASGGTIGGYTIGEHILEGANVELYSGHTGAEAYIKFLGAHVSLQDNLKLSARGCYMNCLSLYATNYSTTYYPSGDPSTSVGTLAYGTYGCLELGDYLGYPANAYTRKILLNGSTGIISSTAYGNTVTIGSINAYWCHFSNSADIPFFFNNGIHATYGFTVYNTNTQLTNNNLTFSHGGGWYMTDATWVRSFNNISIYTGGKVRGDGGLEVHGLGNSGGQLKMLYGDYGVMLRNDGGAFYLLQTAKGDSGGTWNSYRPFVCNLSTGEVQISGSRFLTNATYLKCNSYYLGFYLSENNNYVFRTFSSSFGDGDNIVYNGSSGSRWIRVYSKDGVATSSDERDKNISEMDERYKDLFMSLHAIEFTWKDDNDGKIHVGVSAQKTEAALIASGFDPDTFAALDHDFWDKPNAEGRIDRYSVNYDEIAMLMLPVVQEHENYITTLDYWKNTVDYQLEQANMKIAELENEIAILKTQVA